MVTEINDVVIPIKELLGRKFFIPSYQRGYRWEITQVEELLNDIKEFSQKKRDNEKEFYCLQPLVVKQKSDNCKELDGCQKCNGCEVLDGQQRLTTILLILKNIIERENKLEEYALGESFENKLYEIDYETRPDSAKFLGKTISEMSQDSKEYIDYFHIHQAAVTIDKWFNDKDTKPEKRSNFDVDFLKNTKVIWHRVNDCPFDAFSRLNMGKIKLTNAELVKSLFLNSSNFKAENKELIRLRQLEIASEWDRIEYALQDAELWGFISPDKQKEYSTRIEYILDLISQNSNNKKDENYTFKYFVSRVSNKCSDISKTEHITNIWLDIKRYFQTIEDWFGNKSYYHKVGYLLATGADINMIVAEWRSNRTNFDKYLIDQINLRIGDANLDELEYKDSRIKKILLLYNVVVLLQNSNDSSRFLFAKYKSERWDVEHIDSNTTNELNKKIDQNTWLDYANTDLNLSDEIKGEIKLFIDDKTGNVDKFNKLYKEIKEIAGEQLEDEEESKNGISNLCLLDAGTNRAYKNALFPTKRRTILERIERGQFVPLCTQNVFLKRYSNSKKGLSLLKWDNTDKDAYVEHIKKTIEAFRELPCSSSVAP